MIIRNFGILFTCKHFQNTEIGRDRPLQKDLLNHVVAAVPDKWREIGEQLLDPALLDQRVLEVIAADHSHSVEGCCRIMVEKWLVMQKNASWNQLIDEVHWIAVFS